MSSGPETRPHFTADTGKRVLRLQHGEGREALIRAVIRVVAQKGLSGLSYRSVAREAGVTHGLVHYHFGTRDNMIVEAMSWAVEHAVETLGLVPHDGDPDADPLEHFVEGLADLSEEDRQAHLFANELILASCRQDDLHAVNEPVYAMIFESLRKLLEEAGFEASPARVRLMFAAINGLTIQHLFFGSPQQSRESGRELRALIEAWRSVPPPAAG